MSDSVNGQAEVIVGIDLGTTNSEVAAYVDGQVRVLGSGGKNMLPSVVGISPSGELLVGEAARNQLVLYPERTVRSVKRLMGSSETVSLGDRQFTPPEISCGNWLRWPAANSVGRSIKPSSPSPPISPILNARRRARPQRWRVWRRCAS